MNILCTRLRFIALHTPRCWTKVFVQIANAERSMPHHILASILERSKNCQFDLTFAFLLEAPNDSVIFGALDVIVPHMHRCRAIATRSIYSAEATERTGAILESYLPAPSVRHIDFLATIGPDIYSNPLGLEQLPVPFLKDNESRVSSMSIELGPESKGHVWRTPRLRGPSFESLTRLRLCVQLDPRRVLEFLQCCPKLEHLYWHSTSEESESSAGELDGLQELQELRLPNLISLTLKSEPALKSFPRLNAPLLAQLVVEDSEDNVVDMFIFREDHLALPNLKRLSYSLTAWRVSHAIDNLRPYHAIEELALTLTSDDDMIPSHYCEMIDCLSRTKNVDEGFLPLLQQIWLETNFADWFDMESISLAGAIRRLLSNRPTVRMQLHVEPMAGYPSHLSGFPDLEVLCQQFPSRITTTINKRIDPLPNWPQAWDSSYF